MTMIPTPGSAPAGQLLKNVDALLLDVDGVLTNGSITYDGTGNEIKTFSVRDGLGIRMLMLSGVQVGIVTGRSSKALVARCRNLGIEHLWDGVNSKAQIVDEIQRVLNMAPERMAFLGDDLPDLGIMARVGVAVAVADAQPEVAAAAHLVTSRPGGGGAVRELCERILKAKGLWDDIRSKVAS